MIEVEEYLKDCPFCGGLAVFERTINPDHDILWWKIRCSMCSIQTLRCYPKEIAVGQWNKRTLI